MIKNIKRALQDIAKLSPRLMWISLFNGFFSGLAPFVSIIISQIIISSLATSFEIHQLFKQILILLLILLISLVISGILEFVFTYEYQNYVMKLEFHRNLKMVNAQYQYVEDPSIKELRNKITVMGYTGVGSMESLGKDIKFYVEHITRVVIGFIVILPIFLNQGSSIAWLNSQWLILLFAILVIMFSLLPLGFAKNYFSQFKRIINKAQHSNTYFNYIGEIIFDHSSGKEIRLYHQQPLITPWFDDLGKEDGIFSEIYHVNYKLLYLRKLIGTLFEYGLVAMLYIYLGVKVLTGNLAVGYLISASAAIALLIQSISSMSASVAVFSSNHEALKLHYQYMDLPNQTKIGSIPVEKRLDNDYELQFKNVSFIYPNTDKEVLKNINLDLEVGKSYAIVGENGSGKTTLVKLLTRLYDPTEGEVTLNGIDVRKYESSQYYNLFNVVFQDFDLFGFKLGETIATKQDVDESKVINIFKEVGFYNRYQNLKKGLDTSLNQEFDSEGISLSGGEKQKLAIARALYKNGPIFVLDEPTAALDPISEFEIYQKFNKITQGKTSLIISHRLSSCRFSDQILVFDQGQIVQKGTHDQLIKQEGKYQQLWNAQAQYYQENDIELSKLQINS